MRKRYQIMIYAFLFGCVFVGGLLGIYLIGIEEGEYSYEMVITGVSGTMGGIIIFFIFKMFSKWRKKRNGNGNVPEIDERSMLLMKRYLLVMFYIVMIGSSALLIILFAMGIQTIDTGMIVVYMAILYLLIGIGVLVVKRI